MVDQASYRSIRDQLVAISVDIEDKAKVCGLLERNIEKERQQLATVEESVKEEYNRIIESEVHHHRQAAHTRTQQSQELVQEKRDLIAKCNDLVSAVKDQEHDLAAEVRAVYKDAEVNIESEKKAFRAGYEDRLQKFLQAKAAEYKDNAEKALHPNITRLQMQHEQEMADVERGIQAQERTLKETATSQLQARLEEERTAAKEEIRLTLRALQDRAAGELDAARREHRKALQRLTEDLERELDRHRLYLRDKAQRSKEQSHLELRQAQEGAQQRLLEIQQRHAKHLESLQQEHDQEVIALRRQADAAKRAQQSALRKDFQQHQAVGLGSRDYNDSDDEDGGRHSARSHASSSRGAFSPISSKSGGSILRKSPQRKGGSLLEYSEFTAGDNASLGSGLGMDDILDGDEGTAEAELELQAVIQAATQDRDRQIQAEIRAIESETLRLERQWRAKAEAEEKQALAAVAKEEEYTAARRGYRGPHSQSTVGGADGGGDDVAELVVKREQLLAQIKALQGQVDRATAEEAEATREVGVYKEGIAAHRARIQDKQEQHRLALREIQLEAGPRLRELKESCAAVVAQVREAADSARQELARIEQEHKAELARLDGQVKSEVGRREDELLELQGAVDEERAKIARFERLIQQYTDKANNGGGRNGSNLEESSVGTRRTEMSGVIRSARSGPSATGACGRGSSAGVSGGASVASAGTRATAGTARLSAHQRLKPAVPTQGAAASTANSAMRRSTTAPRSDVRTGGTSPRSGSAARSRSGSEGVHSSRPRSLHATHTAATSSSDRHTEGGMGSSSTGDDDRSHGNGRAGATVSSRASQRPGSALHRTVPAMRSGSWLNRGDDEQSAGSDDDGRLQQPDYGSGDDTDEEPQPVPAWISRRAIV